MEQFRAYTCDECENQTVITGYLKAGDPANHNCVYIDCPRCKNRKHSGGNRIGYSFEEWIDGDSIVRSVSNGTMQQVLDSEATLWNDKGINVNTGQSYDKEGHRYTNADRRAKFGDAVELSFTDEDGIQEVCGVVRRFGNFYEVFTGEDSYTVKTRGHADRMVNIVGEPTRGENAQLRLIKPWVDEYQYS